MNLQRAFALAGMLVVGLYLVWVVFIWVAADQGKPSGAVLHHFDIEVTEGSKLQVRRGEIERLVDKQLQTGLYLAIDQRKLFIQGGKRPQAIPIADFSLLLSTTDEYRLLQPLRDRMKLVLRFEFYDEDDLTTLLVQRSKALGWLVYAEVLPLIAQRSRGTPRLALRLLQTCRRVCRAAGERTIKQEHLEKACLLEKIDALGLGHVEQHYLRILADGPNRLNVIASMIGLPARTVSQVTEPFLIRMGLVVKDDQGRRVLTAKGREHL